MHYTLSPEEKFSDRIEIVGYATAIMTSVFWLVYFGMIFFYKPVQQHGLGIQALVLLFSLYVLAIGFFIPLLKNWARVGYRLFFHGFAIFCYYRTINYGEWYFALALVYSFYILWVLSHPMGVSRFRPLKPHEEKQQAVGSWFTIHRLILLLYALIIGLNGLFILTEPQDNYLYNSDLGMLYVFLSLVMQFLLIFFRRLHNWARWCLALICIGIGVAGIPATINPKAESYLEYWKALLNVFYFLGTPAYLLFSPALRRAFKGAKKSTPGSSDLKNA